MVWWLPVNSVVRIASFVGLGALVCLLVVWFVNLLLWLIVADFY